MSAAEILSELPKLTEAERRPVGHKLAELTAENEDVTFCDQAALAGATMLERMEADDVRQIRPSQIQEIWRIKAKLSREMAADPAGYSAKLDRIAQAEEKTGRKIIHSADELRQLVSGKERQLAQESAAALNDKPSGNA